MTDDDVAGVLAAIDGALYDYEAETDDWVDAMRWSPTAEAEHEPWSEPEGPGPIGYVVGEGYVYSPGIAFHGEQVEQTILDEAHGWQEVGWIDGDAFPEVYQRAPTELPGPLAHFNVSDDGRVQIISDRMAECLANLVQATERIVTGFRALGEAMDVSLMKFPEFPQIDLRPPPHIPKPGPEGIEPPTARERALQARQNRGTGPERNTFHRARSRG